MCFWCYIFDQYPEEFGGQKWPRELKVIDDESGYFVCYKNICFKCVKKHFNLFRSINFICEFINDLPWHDIVREESGKFYLLSDDFPVKIPLNEHFLVKNVHVPFWFIELHPEGLNGISWSSRSINYNKNLTLEIIKSNPTGLFGNKWIESALSFNRCMTIEFMETKLSRNWRHCDLPSNESIPWEFFLENLKPSGKIHRDPEFADESDKWDMFRLSQRIPQEFLENHPNDFFGQKWDRDGLIRNKNLTFEFILENSDLLFDKETLCRREDFPWKILEKSSHELPFELDIYCLSQNDSLPMEVLESHPNGIDGKFWDLQQISLSKSLTWNFVEAHPEGFCGQKWNLDLLSTQKWKKDIDEIRFKRIKLAAI